MDLMSENQAATTHAPRRRVPPFPPPPAFGMMAAMIRILMTAALLTLAACSSHDQPKGLSDEENRQLNEAAAMLDANAVDLNAMAPSDVGEDDSTDNES